MLPENLDAAIIIIGNEILSGKTQDLNIQFLATELGALGIKLKEVRVIPDLEEDIIATVNFLRAKYSYVFTTGGIGPTHDDITSQTVAKAFSDEFVLHKQAKEMLEIHAKNHNKTIAPEHLRMCYMPKGAIPLLNRETGAPGFKLENVFVMAGVPYIMQAMFKEAKKHLKTGKPIISKSIDVYLSESLIAEDFSLLQNKYPSIEMGSYPFRKEDKWGTVLSLRGNEPELIDQAMQELLAIIEKFHVTPNESTEGSASFLTKRSEDREYHEVTQFPEIPGQAALARDDDGGERAARDDDGGERAARDDVSSK